MLFRSMMPVLIQGPRQPGNDIDVYLRPLVDELLELWAKPGGAPPPGEGGCPRSWLGWEEGDYDVQQLVGEVANAVVVRLGNLRFWLISPPLDGRLVLHLSRRQHRGNPAVSSAKGDSTAAISGMAALGEADRRRRVGVMGSPGWRW